MRFPIDNWKSNGVLNVVNCDKTPNKSYNTEKLTNALFSFGRRMDQLRVIDSSADADFSRVLMASLREREKDAFDQIVRCFGGDTNITEDE